MGAISENVIVVAPPGGAFGPALSAGLAARDWEVHEVRTMTPDPTVLRAGAVLVVEDDDGHAELRVPPRVSLHECVCLGSERSTAMLLRLHGRGATVLNLSTPLLPLLHLVDRFLREPRGAGGDDTASVGRALQQRLVEAAALNRLTPAERLVLRAIVAGHGASAIGAHRHVSVHTVRSHIKSILAKLGARSQLEAVAIAHRSGRYEVAMFTTFGEDDAPAPSRL